MKMVYCSMEDRLSELPDSLILEILSLMPAEDIVRTTILSKRWKDFWTSVPSFNFEAKDPVARTRIFLHEFLLRWKGVCIRNFNISFSSSSSNSFDLDSWVRFATEKKVENLRLDQAFDWRKPSETSPELQRLPQCVYSCSSIKKLRISGFNLEIEEGVHAQWDKLTSLYIDASCLSEDVINQVVSSAPCLEEFELRLRSSDHNLKIESSSLKTLSITKYNVYSPFRDPLLYKELTIRAPKLESLRLWGNAYRHCDVQMDGESSLKSVSLCFYEKYRAELQGTLRQILPSIRGVEEVTLSPCAFKMLGWMQNRGSFLLLLFPNVKKLNLDGGPVTAEEMAGLSRVFPRVETLLIHWKLDGWYRFFLKSLPPELDSDAAKPCCLNHLRTADIIPYANYDRAEFHSVLRFLRDHAAEAVVRKGDGGLKLMLDELKAKCRLKRLRPGAWSRILVLSVAVGVINYFII